MFHGLRKSRAADLANGPPELIVKRDGNAIVEWTVHF